MFQAKVFFRKELVPACYPKNRFKDLSRVSSLQHVSIRSCRSCPADVLVLIMHREHEYEELRITGSLINSSPRNWALFAGPLLAATLALVMSSYGWDAKVCWTGAISVLCVVWWIFEPIPIPATSIIPLAVFPLAGILSQEKIAAAYGSDLILLMLGGFMISAAMARSGSHRRLALTLVNVIGGHSSRRIVGFHVRMCRNQHVDFQYRNSRDDVAHCPRRNQ